MNEIFSRKHAGDDSCVRCGTPIKLGVTTQYIDDLDVEVCVVCEQPLASESLK